MDAQRLKEAKEYLDQLDKDLCEELKYEKDGEEFFRRMEWEIRRYNKELFEAIKLALGDWLDSDDEGKFVCALDLIDRFRAVEHLSRLEKLRTDLQSGTSRWPASLYLDLVETVLNTLREAEKKK